MATGPSSYIGRDDDRYPDHPRSDWCPRSDREELADRRPAPAVGIPLLAMACVDGTYASGKTLHVEHGLHLE